MWTAVTAGVMFALAAGKARTGRAMGNQVLLTEGRVTTIDGLLAVAVLVGPVLDPSGQLHAVSLPNTATGRISARPSND